MIGKVTFRFWQLLLIAAFIFLLGAFAAAPTRTGGDRTVDNPVRFATARDAVADPGGYPQWGYEPRFSNDVFTFVRIQYTVDGTHGFGHTDPEARWAIDFPDSDLNFSYRLQQLTSIKVNPNPIHIKLTDKELYNYPFIYFVEPGRLTFTETEVPILRTFLLNGGFAMFDDFWGEREWQNFYTEIKRIFPDREPIELPLEHPIFHSVFDLKEKPQVPYVALGIDSQYTGITWERADAKEVHYKAIFDDKNRMMVMICHNTDLGDGWEREGENEYYFHEFSEKKAYPLGINIVFYAMTH